MAPGPWSALDIGADADDRIVVGPATFGDADVQRHIGAEGRGDHHDQRIAGLGPTALNQRRRRQPGGQQ